MDVEPEPGAAPEPEAAPDAPAPPPAPTRRPGRCRLTLTINNSNYDVRPIAPGDDSVLKAFRLTRDGHVYDVALHPYGHTCDCPDFIFRRDGLDPEGCLHIRAMIAVGLLG